MSPGAKRCERSARMPSVYTGGCSTNHTSSRVSAVRSAVNACISSETAGNGRKPRSRTSGASTDLYDHDDLAARDEIAVHGVELRAVLGVHRDREAQVVAFLAHVLDDFVRVAVVGFGDLDGGGAEFVVVATEHLDRHVGRKLQQRFRRLAHFSAERKRDQTLPSATPVSTTSGALASRWPPNETLTEPTVAPAVRGAARSWSRSILAWSNAKPPRGIVTKMSAAGPTPANSASPPITAAASSCWPAEYSLRVS